MLYPTLNTPQTIEAYRKALAWCLANGACTPEEHAVGTGNLAEAEAKLRLAAQRN